MTKLNGSCWCSHFGKDTDFNQTCFESCEILLQTQAVLETNIKTSISCCRFTGCYRRQGECVCVREREREREKERDRQAD